MSESNLVSQGGTVLILRTCKSDMTSYGGFQWPGIGEKVEAPDWDPRPICGYGLHGLLWGIGGSNYLDEGETAKGVVFEAEDSEVVWIDGDKVKVPAGVVRFIGTLGEAAAWLDERKPTKEKAGYRGTATAGDRGTATAGYRGTATAGDRGTATAGYRGTATAGDRGTASAGVGGAVVIQRWNGNRYVLSVAAIKDEDGQGQLEPNVRYRLDDAGAFVPVLEENDV